MRTMAEIAATAGLMGCVLVYAVQTRNTLAQTSALDLTTQDAVLAREVAEMGEWVGRPLARCYAEELSVDGLKDGSAPARALACDGAALQPAAG